MKILIVKLSSIGDVVHTLPALNELKKAYPSARIDWIVEEEAGNILTGHPLLNDVFIIKKRGWLNDFKNTCNIAKKIWASHYDIALDFQGLFKSGLWVFLSRGKRRIGFDKRRELSHLFLNEKLPPYDPEKHAVDRYLGLVRHLGIEVKKVVFPIPVSDNEKKKISGLLKAGGIWEGIPFIVVNPVARWETKLWGAEKFAKLCSELMSRLSCKVVIVGAASGKINEKIMSLTGNRIADFTGKTTLKDLAYLMSLSKMVITVDSGPMHIAAAMGAPVIAIFGPTAPWRTGPYGENHTIIRKELPCSPCFSEVCKDMDGLCMRDIEVGDVLAAAETHLQRVKERVGGTRFAT